MKYVIFLLLEIDKLDFEQLENTSKDTLRVSKEGKAIIKYRGSMPECIKNLKWKSNVYTHEQIKHIINTEEEWLLDAPSKLMNN
jgi:hypothetical protein